MPNLENHCPPSILLLGPPGIVRTRGGVEAGKRQRLIEYAAFLALHPGATAIQIDDAIWPERKAGDNTNTRNTATAKLRSWLGKDDAGADFLPRHPGSCGYRFTAAVGCDVVDFQALASNNLASCADVTLDQALGLVRGRPFAGVHPKRYRWADMMTTELTDQIRDVATELAERAAHRGDWRRCGQVSAIGLSVDDADEHLWRLRLEAAHRVGDRTGLRQTAARLQHTMRTLDCALEPETAGLLAALGEGTRL